MSMVNDVSRQHDDQHDYDANDADDDDYDNGDKGKKGKGKGEHLL